MEFEIDCVQNTHLHPLLSEAQDNWIARQPAMAYQSFRKQSDALQDARKAGSLTAHDWRFVVSILNSCSMFNQAKVVAKQGLLDFPEDEELVLESLWELAASGKMFECIERIDNHLERATAHQASRLESLRVYAYSYSGWRQSASKYEPKALELARADALSFYILSRAASFRSEWKSAVEFGHRAVQLAPKWARARATLSDSLLAVGSKQEALKNLQLLPADATPFFSYGMSEAYAMEAVGEAQIAIQRLESLLREWPVRSRYQRIAETHLLLLLLSENREEEANHFMASRRIKKFPVERQSGVDRKKTISLPMIAQSHNHCVPTVAAMVASSQGYPASPIEFAVGMKCNDGTPLWRMIDYMSSIGFSAHCVRPDLNSVEYFIDRNIPLIGSTSGLFSSHVDVICGYDRAINLLHIRDPMHWHGICAYASKIQSRYSGGDGLWALVRNSSSDVSEIPDELKWPEGEAIIRIARAVTNADRLAAEEAFQQIPDDHPLALSRNGYANDVVITQREYDRQLKAFANWEEEPLKASTMRAILSQIDENNAEDVIKMIDQRVDTFGSKFANYIRCQCFVAQQKWRDAQQLLAVLSRDIPQLESLWRLYSLVEEQLGNAELAESLLKNALDIEPNNVNLNRRLLELKSDEITYDARLARVQELCDASPDNTEGRWLLFKTIIDGGDGLKIEQAMREAIRYFPRQPSCYEMLARWYLRQGRNDLAKQVLLEGRSLLEEVDLPLFDFEIQEQNDKVLEVAGETKETGDLSSSAPADANKGDEVRTDAFTEKMNHVVKMSKELSSAETLKLNETQELIAIDDEGTLPWSQSASFRSWLLGKNLLSPGSSVAEKKNALDEFRSMLPRKAIPGIPESYATLLFDLLEIYPLTALHAGVLLEWLRENCPDSSKYPRLEFSRAYLQELSGKLNDAEKTLDSIIERYPTFSASWYRKGQIARSRADLKNAIRFHKKCLFVAPSIDGAMNELIDIYSYLQEPEEQVYREQLLKLYPYSRLSIYRAAAGAGKQANSVDKAIEFIQSQKERMCHEDFVLLQARLLADFEQFDAAANMVATLPSVSSKNASVADWLKVDCYLAKQNFSDAIDALLTILERDKDDQEALDQLVRLYREVQPAKAVTFAKNKLQKGVSNYILAYVFCQYEKDPVKAAIDLLKNLESEPKDRVAAAFGEAFHQNSLHSHLLSYLKWVDTNLPHLVDMRETYAIRLNMAGQNAIATRVAEDLNRLEPDNPRWLRLLGICIQDIDTKKSIEYLKKEFELTGSSDTLVRLGRGYQLCDDPKAARHHYYGALEINPHETLAITNLVFKYNELSPELHRKANEALDHGHGVQDQYFHVCAIKLAKQVRGKVSTSWYATALQRYQLVLNGEGFRDEPSKLKYAILSWANAIGDKNTLKKYGSVLDRLSVRFRWPGNDWIPKDSLAKLAE